MKKRIVYRLEVIHQEKSHHSQIKLLSFSEETFYTSRVFLNSS